MTAPRTWRCGFCGSETESRGRPLEGCRQCGSSRWEEAAGDHFRLGGQGR